MKSFYNPEYVIEITEKRFATYVSAYHMVMNKYAVLMLFYSGISALVLPMLKKVILLEKPDIMFVTFVFIFLCHLSGSIIMAVFLLFPESEVFLPNPDDYNNTLKNVYEGAVEGNEIPLILDIDSKLVKAYLKDVTDAMTDMEAIYTRKWIYYSISFMLVITSIPIFLICLFYSY